MRRVLNKETGKIGFVVGDSFRCCSPEEDAVVYDGTNIFIGTDRSLLEEIDFEVPIPEPTKCGAGRAEECCIFLTVGANGFECGRFGNLRNTLIFRTMNAKRNPKEVYPQCMKF